MSPPPSKQRSRAPTPSSMSSLPTPATTFMNSVTSGLGTGIGFGIGNRLFGGPSNMTPAQPPLAHPSVDPCNEMKTRLFAMKESPNQDEERYNRLFEEYEKLCTHTK